MCGHGPDHEHAGCRVSAHQAKRNDSLTLACSFDIDYPLDVDDEFWETGNPETDFKQPPDKPSRMSYFVTILKLTRIIGDVLKTVVGGG